MELRGLRAPRGRVRHVQGSLVLRGLLSDHCPLVANGASLTRLVNLGGDRVPLAYSSGAATPLSKTAWVGQGVRNGSYNGWARVQTGWQPNGGHAAATIMLLFQVESVQQSGAHFFSLAGPTTNPRIWFFSNVGNLGGGVQMSSAVTMTTTIGGAASGNLRCAILTTRSATDHEIWAFDYTARTFNVQTSSGNAGTAAANGAQELLGQAAGVVNYGTDITVLRAATWARGMTRDEMIALGHNPFLGWADDTGDGGWWMDAAPPTPWMRRPRGGIICGSLLSA
jgi:hypothetical protein